MAERLSQTYYKNTKRPLHYIGLVVIFAIVMPVAFADDYLDSLHNEADKLEYLDETRSSNIVTTRKNVVSREIQQALNSINAFEKYFKTTDPATAAIYFRLTTQERLRIYHRFKSSKDFNLAKKMTIELFNQKQ